MKPGLKANKVVKVVRRKTYTRIIHGSYAGAKQGEGWKEWRNLGKAVKIRDSYTCRKCKRTLAQLKALGLWLEVDHIRPVSRGGTDTMQNLWCLCNMCHSRRGAAGHTGLKQRQDTYADKAKGKSKKNTSKPSSKSPNKPNTTKAHKNGNSKTPATATSSKNSVSRHGSGSSGRTSGYRIGDYS